jgi:dsDNA-binding SOS-regulon protein
MSDQIGWTIEDERGEAVGVWLSDQRERLEALRREVQAGTVSEHGPSRVEVKRLRFQKWLHQRGLMTEG